MPSINIRIVDKVGRLLHVVHLFCFEFPVWRLKNRLDLYHTSLYNVQLPSVHKGLNHADYIVYTVTIFYPNQHDSSPYDRYNVTAPRHVITAYQMFKNYVAC